MEHSDPLERATRQRERGETWTDEQFRDARDTDLRERTSDVSAAVKSALTCLVLAALLTSGKIVEIAERQELGTTRDRQVDVANGVDRVANFLSLNRPYDWIQDVRGAGEDAGERVDTIEEVEPPAAIDDGEGLGSSDATEDDSPVADDPDDSAEDPPPPSTTIAAFPLRTVDGAAPLIVYVAGDSQAEYLGQAITTESGDRALDVEVEDRISTSLARPDYFNWPAEITSMVDRLDPDAVVLFIGANDHQDMAAADGTRLVEGTVEWQQEWTRRLELTLDLLESDDRHVFWVTQPPMRDSGLDEGIDLINELAAPVVAERDFVSAIDIWELFGGSDGFSERIARADGDEIRARIDDGVHLTRNAASWVADIVFTEMDDVWSFSP